jgi:hypothetical protein
MNSLVHSVPGTRRFGLKLDLERFMIVATSDFNMGAMENKGLNIFNTKYVLASPPPPPTPTSRPSRVVGHEYFHNWTATASPAATGSSSLKEGLTVFRDQEFSMDMAGTAGARAVKRIGDVRVLRTVQFPEDAGPMAHPVRPDAYRRSTTSTPSTIYEKAPRWCACRPGGPRRLSPGHEAVLRAPRRPGRDLRRLRPGHGRRQPRQRAGPAPGAVQALVQPGRHARASSRRALGRRRADLHPDAVAKLPAHARPADKQPS